MLLSKKLSRFFSFLPNVNNYELFAYIKIHTEARDDDDDDRW